MTQLTISCSKSPLFIGLACKDVVIKVDKYPKEDELILIPSPHYQRGGDASSSAVVYSLLQNKYKNIAPYDTEKVYFMGTLPTTDKSDFVVKDLQKYENINYDLCYYNKNNNTPISYIFISSKTGSRTIAHHPLKYSLTYKQFLGLTENINLSNKFNLIFFDFKWPSEMSPMIEYIYNNYKNKIIVATELETANYFDNSKNCDVEQIIMWSDVIFFSQQYLTETGYENSKTPIKFLKDIIGKYKTSSTDKIFVVPWGKVGSYCVQLSDYKNIIFCKGYSPPNGKVIDTLGAGDTFNASFLFGLRRGWNIRRCCDFANAVAAYKVGFHGFDCVKSFKHNINAKL